MSEPSEENNDQSEKAPDVDEQAQDTSAKSDESPAEAQAPATESEAKPEKPKVKPAEAEAKTTTAPEKPLEKMTVKELREMAKDIPGISGVHAMKKDELLVEIKKAKGVKDEPIKKADASIADLKRQIRALKVERQAALEAKDKKKATIFKRRISRLKKKTRRVAA